MQGDSDRFGAVETAGLKAAPSKEGVVKLKSKKKLPTLKGSPVGLVSFLK